MRNGFLMKEMHLLLHPEGRDGVGGPSGIYSAATNTKSVPRSAALHYLLRLEIQAARANRVITRWCHEGPRFFPTFCSAIVNVWLLFSWLIMVARWPPRLQVPSTFQAGKTEKGSAACPPCVSVFKNTCPQSPCSANLA